MSSSDVSLVTHPCHRLTPVPRVGNLTPSRFATTSGISMDLGNRKTLFPPCLEPAFQHPYFVNTCPFQINRCAPGIANLLLSVSAPKVGRSSTATLLLDSSLRASIGGLMRRRRRLCAPEPVPSIRHRGRLGPNPTPRAAPKCWSQQKRGRVPWRRRNPALRNRRSERTARGIKGKEGCHRHPSRARNGRHYGIQPRNALCRG